jgi:hypothetical protein
VAEYIHGGTKLLPSLKEGERRKKRGREGKRKRGKRKVGERERGREREREKTGITITIQLCSLNGSPGEISPSNSPFS